MRLFFRFVVVMVILPTMQTLTAHAQSSVVYLVTYIELMPNAVDSGKALLARHGAASRQESGNLRFDVLQEIARPDRFAFVEVWKDKNAVDIHGSAASDLQFRDSLRAIQSAPNDQRVEGGLFVGTAKSESPAGAVYVLTHVDITPQHNDAAAALLNAMGVDSGNEQGNLNYEVLQQVNRPNHFALVEEWASRMALDAHTMAPHTRTFRETLLPMQGALYDERRYKKLR